MDSATGSEPAAWYLAATPGAVGRWTNLLVRGSVAIDGLVLVAAFVLPAGEFPLRRVAPLVAALAFIGLERSSSRRRGDRVTRLTMAAHLMLLVALLTGLLELSGGPSNAFSVIYAALIALAAVTLGGAWATAVAVASVAGYGLLISWHLEELVPAHHRLIDFPTHLFTMWIAISTMAELAAHFIGAASLAVMQRESVIGLMRAESARNERLVSLTTLAAGAAHELSTPLATIAIASKELELALARARVPDELSADARLIREEVGRCQLILDLMSGRASGSAAERPSAVSVDSLLSDVRERLTGDRIDRLRANPASGLPTMVVLRTCLVQVLLSLLKNAFDASTATALVTLDVTAVDGNCRFAIGDTGAGLSPEAVRRAGEPFYTTKPAGQGVGLGLFLARAFAEQCGGSLTLHSDNGTVAILDLPVNAFRVDVAS
jgi:two-component system sensor histidine kinase RegB